MSEKRNEKKVTGKVKGGIGIRLMSMFVLLILVPLIIMGFTMYNKSKSILEENLQASSNQLVLQTETSILNFLQRFEDVERVLAANSNFQNVNSGVVSVVDEEAEPVELQRNVGYDDLFKEQYANDPYKVGMWEQLSDLTDVNKDVLWAYMGTENGNMLMRPDGELPADYDARIRPWYKDAVAAQDLIWTAPYPDSTTGDLVISVAIPVKEPNGGSAGVSV